MFSCWYRFQAWPIWLRSPIEWMIFALVVFFVLYPKPSLFLRNVAHLRHLNDLPNPKEPTLQPVEARFDAFLDKTGVATTDTAGILKAVNAFVLGEIPYGYDWEVWGVVDYVPTVAELTAKGKEDCDGRAVLAASLLRAKGIDARLVGDARHMWVSTPHGDTMNPLGPPTFRADDKGMHVQWLQMFDPGPVAFGLSVFPFGREMIILLTVWLLALSPGVSPRRAALAVFLLVEGLVLFRLAGMDPMKPNYGGIAWAGTHVIVALGILWAAGRKRNRSRPPRQLYR